MNKKGIIIAAIGMAVIAVGIGGYILIISNSNDAVPVKVALARKENIVSTITATGVVQEGNRTNLYTNSSLKVKKVYVKIGDKVSKGQTLAELDTDSVKMQIQEAKINYNIEKTNLNNLNEDLNNHLKGSLKDNQAISDIITVQSNLTSAKIDLDKKQLAFDRAKTMLETNKKLFNGNAIAKQDLDNSQKDVDSASIDLQGAMKVYENAQNDYTKVMNSQQELVQQQVQQVQQQINVQYDKVALAELKVNQLLSNLKDVDLESGKVLAPVDGYVGPLGIIEGGFSKPEEVAISIVNLDELIINAKVLENDVKDVKVGDKVNITGDSIGTEKYQGSVQNVSVVATKQEINKMEQTVLDVGILVTSEKTILRPGFNVDLKIETGNMQGVLSVPNDAVKEDKDSNKYVYVVDKGKAKKVSLDVAIKSDTFLGIKEKSDGIVENSKVIYSSTGILAEGTLVKVIQEK